MNRNAPYHMDIWQLAKKSGSQWLPRTACSASGSRQWPWLRIRTRRKRHGTFPSMDYRSFPATDREQKKENKSTQYTKLKCTNERKGRIKNHPKKFTNTAIWKVITPNLFTQQNFHCQFYCCSLSLTKNYRLTNFILDALCIAYFNEATHTKVAVVFALQCLHWLLRSLAAKKPYTSMCQ